MKRKITWFILFVVIFVLFSPVNEVNGATKKVTVTTKVETYKGQEYIKVNGGNKTATTKINKKLKNEAVQSAQANSEYKKDNNGYNYIYQNTLFNKNELLSVSMETVVNVGGPGSIHIYSVYNFNLKTGDIIQLKDLTPTQNQLNNLNEAVVSGLLEKKSKGISIPEDNIKNPSYDDASFYYYNSGIVIRFNPQKLFSTSYIDIKVPFKTINKSKPENAITEPLKFVLNESTKSDLKIGKITGFAGLNLGMTKKQVSDTLGMQPNDSFYDLGGEFWTYKIAKNAGFNFDDGSGTSKDMLRYVIIGAGSLTFSTFAEVHKSLGKPVKSYYDDILLDLYVEQYKFGENSIDIFADTSKSKISYVQIYRK
ncbi:hypothetical protein [Paenibacillus sp. USHLN196]|uniref:hypothetical protein n=1 Tax=Paenibacillus sp. USHLN196 TaxID=3081291 RepID=UPI00301ADC55